MLNSTNSFMAADTPKLKQDEISVDCYSMKSTWSLFWKENGSIQIPWNGKNSEHWFLKMIWPENPANLNHV